MKHDKNQMIKEARRNKEPLRKPKGNWWETDAYCGNPVAMGMHRATKKRGKR